RRAWYYASSGLRGLRHVDVQLDEPVPRAPTRGRVVRDRASLPDAFDDHLLLPHAAAEEHFAHRLRASQRQFLVVRRRAGGIGVALDADPILRILDQDVAELRHLLDGLGPEHRAVRREQQLRLEIDEDAVLGALGVLRHLLQFLRLLVEIVAHGAAGDAARGRADQRALPAPGESADAGSDGRASARANRRALTRGCAR